MKVVYCVLELGKGAVPSVSDVAKLSGLTESDVTIKGLADCTSGNHKRFALVADLYLWTCKLWYGLSQDKLTFVELRGVEEVPPLFQLKYSAELRLAVHSKQLSIFDADGMAALRRVSHVSASHFNEERIAKLSEIIGVVEPYYDLLYVSNNPFS